MTWFERKLDPRRRLRDDTVEEEPLPEEPQKSSEPIPEAVETVVAPVAETPPITSIPPPLPLRIYRPEQRLERKVRKLKARDELARFRKPRAKRRGHTSIAFKSDLVPH